MNIHKPFSQASENNKASILEVLKTAFAEVTNVLEVGSGTGQHAIYFAQHLPHLKWQPTDLAENLPGVQSWLDEARLQNTLPLKELNVNELPWTIGKFDAAFTANTLHIMGEPEVERFFKGVSEVILEGGRLCIYGPFNYAGKFTSESNARFNDWLYQQNPKSAIRDFEWICELAEKGGFTLVDDHTMPANNRLLEMEKR